MAPDKRTIAYRVADAVSRTVGYRVTPGYRSGPRATTQWYLEWVNGLTEKQMAAKVRAAGREVAGYHKDLLELRREADERHLVAAWLLHHDPLDPDNRTLNRSNAGWQAKKHFEITSFPRDLPDDHELWTLVDEAFEATTSHDRPWHDAEAAIVYLANTGVQALRVRRWLDAVDRLGPHDPPPPHPPLDARHVPDTVLAELDTALAAVAWHLGGANTIAHNPRVRLLTLEAVGRIVGERLDRKQLDHAMQAVADGDSLSRLSVLLGLHRTTLGKRWPGSRADAVLRPHAWLVANLDTWRTACADAAAAIQRLDDGILFDRDLRSLAWSLAHTVEIAGGWRDVAGTPEQARALLAALTAYRDRLARNSWAGSAPAPLAPEIAAPLDRLVALLADYDTAEAPNRRGGNRRPAATAPEPDDVAPTA